MPLPLPMPCHLHDRSLIDRFHLILKQSVRTTQLTDMLPKWLARVSYIGPTLGPKTPLLLELSPPYGFTVHFPSLRLCFFFFRQNFVGFFNKNGEILENLVFLFWIWLIFLFFGKKSPILYFWNWKTNPCSLTITR